MKNFKQSISQVLQTLSITTLLSLSGNAISNEQTLYVDNFNHATNNNFTLPRQFMNDSMAGGKTTTTQMVSEGILEFKGEIAPPRGQPGWASAVLPLAAMDVNYDASNYKGVELRIKLNQGTLNLSANSTEIKNFDFHSAPIVVPADGKFHQVKIPFTAMKRGWSEQTAINPKTLNSLSLVAFSLQKANFDFAVDQVSFY